jgi:hypothetical protein
LNNSLLEHEAYKIAISQLISKIKGEFTNVLSCRSLWDFCKVKIKEHSIKFASNLRKELNNEVYEAESKLHDVDKALMNATDITEIEQLSKQKCDLKSQVDAIYSAKSTGAQIRSRAKWIEDGEKNSKYFLGLENKRQTNNYIATLKNKSGHNIIRKDLIINEAVNFYQNLYGPSLIQENDIDLFFNELGVNHTLSDEESAVCEGHVTVEECTHVISNMGVNKSPGYDGLTSEFYQCFWKNIKSMVVNSFNEAFEAGDLAETHKQSIITLLFKKGERDELKNYRPISLSNADYKILAHVLANRLQNVIFICHILSQIS